MTKSPERCAAFHVGTLSESVAITMTPAVQLDCYFKEALRPTRFRTVISAKPVV